MVVLKELIFINFYIGQGVNALERTEFQKFLHSEGVVVMKELIYHSIYMGTVSWLMKELISNSF